MFVLNRTPRDFYLFIGGKNRLLVRSSLSDSWHDCQLETCYNPGRLIFCSTDIQ